MVRPYFSKQPSMPCMRSMRSRTFLIPLGTSTRSLASVKTPASSWLAPDWSPSSIWEASDSSSLCNASWSSPALPPACQMLGPEQMPLTNLSSVAWLSSGAFASSLPMACSSWASSTLAEDSDGAFQRVRPQSR